MMIDDIHPSGGLFINHVIYKWSVICLSAFKGPTIKILSLL